MFDQRRESKLTAEAAKVGHPDPQNATWGEVNLLGAACFSNGNRPVDRKTAESILHTAEFDAEFNS